MSQAQGSATGIDMDELRTATLGTLLALAAEHGLRIPRSIATDETWDVGPCLRLGVERDVDVDAWAAILGGDPEDREDATGRHHGFMLIGLDVPVWLGWVQVYVDCYAFNRERSLTPQEHKATSVNERLLVPCGRCGHGEGRHFGRGPGRRGCGACPTGNCEPVLVRVGPAATTTIVDAEDEVE